MRVAIERDADPGPVPRSRSGLRFAVGDEVRWLGQAWLITAEHRHPRYGRFFHLEGENGAYDLVHENGNDGHMEPLHA